MHVKMVAALIIAMYLGKLLPMELPDTITVVSRDAQEFVINKDIFSLSNTFLFLLAGGAQETLFHFREFNSDEFEEVLELMATIAHLRQNGSKRYVKFQKAKEKLWFLSTKSLEELGGLMVIANFLDIDSLQQLIAYFIAWQLDPRLGAKDINDVFEKLNISESENPKKYITKELELKQVSKNPFQKSDRLLCCNHASSTKRQEIRATILGEGDFSWRKLPVEAQLQMLETYLLSQTNPTMAAKELLERIRTVTFTDLPIEVKEQIFLYLIKRDETIFQQFKQLILLSQINRQTCTLLHTHCQALKLDIPQQVVKSNNLQAEITFLELFNSPYINIDEVKAFVTSGIDINKKTTFGYTALMLASRWDYNIFKEIVKLLLANGADVNALSNDGYTALMLASREGRTEIVKLLLDKGAEVDAKDGLTALMLASQSGRTEIVKLLLDKGAKVNVNAKDGLTVLMHASQSSHTEIVRLLLDKDAEVNARDTREQTALMHASNYGHLEIVKLLLASSADVNARRDDGYTALMLASQEGRTEIVKLLLDRGAKVNAKDIFGQTALSLTYNSQGREEIIALLLDSGATLRSG